MEDNSNEYLQEYLEELGYKVQTLEKKVKALEIALLTTGILAFAGFIIFRALYFF